MLACNQIHVHSIEQVEGLINLPCTVLCYNVWIVPAKLAAEVQALVTKAENCLANVVVHIDDSIRATELLAGPMKEVLRVGSPNEHLLDLCCEHDGLPDGAAKHLLGISDPKTRTEFADLLRKFADISPTQLPKTVPPDRGIDDVHEVRL